MSAPTVLESQQSAPGCWKLAAGRALSLHPRQRGVLEVAQGRVWLTAGGVDWVLRAGERRVVEAGQHAVMEGWGGGPVAFRWDVAPALVGAAVPCDAQKASMAAMLFIGRAAVARASYGLTRVNPEKTMNSHSIQKSQQSIGAVAPGGAISLSPRVPMVLRIAEGQAWATLSAGPHGEAAGDVFLHPGQALHVAPGQHAVVEPVGGRALCYRWTAAQALDASPAPWWRRAAFGGTAAEPDACWA